MADTAEVLGSLLAAVRSVVPFGAPSVWELDPAGSLLTPAGGRASQPAPPPCAVADSPLGRQALVAGHAQTSSGPAAPPDPLAAPSGGQALALRLGPAGRPAGLLVIHAPAPDSFAPQTITALQALCELGADALAAARRASELARAEADRDQFIHVTTHELRSPLAVSQTLIRNVVKGYAGPLSDKQKDVFTRISGQLDRLEGLVNDLLDLAASRAIAAAALAPVMLNAAIGRVVLLFSPNADEKGIKLVLRPCREEMVVRATEEGLDRIFVNLVGNAIKYTPRGGSVTIASTCAGGRVVTTVTDTGLGIPDEAMVHLFEEFYRAPNARAANITGTGLGLAIVKELVQRFRGEIAVESAAGEGTTFTVSLPLDR